MVKRVSFDWLAAGEHPTMAHVFEHIGVTWPIEEREKILRIASITAFPPHDRSQVWGGYDQSRATVQNKFYYPVTASLTDRPSTWFKNLRILQIRKVLNLVSSVRVGLHEPSLLAGEVLAKTRALERVVGIEMMTRASVPQMKKPRIQGLMSATRATALRNAGTRAQNARAFQHVRN